VPGVLAGQGNARAGGRVIEVRGLDSIPVAHGTVVLHRVGHQRQGPIDSTATDGRGAFRFRFTSDTESIYLLSARLGGIEYFSTPLHIDPALPDTGMVILVSDTSSTALVRTSSRHVVVSSPGREGGRAVLEIIVLDNPGTLTRIAGDTNSPTWRARLPQGANQFQPGSGDFSPEALVASRGEVKLFAPVAPGEKRVIFSYLLPAAIRHLEIPVSDSIPTMNVLLEEASARVKGILVAADSEQVEGRTFYRWTGDVVAGSRIDVTFGSGPARAWVLPALVGLLGVLFLAALVYVGRTRVRAPTGTTGTSPLVDQLAKLDATYRGREGEVAGEEWERYRSERARLKAELEAMLAKGGNAP
jgi:hypothetical protein